ncbi:MAG: N-6 DNA methylase [Luteolibacter sp.]|uniref:N-6 DNA methylase n=1 Tax=Luteolibacter sp. TaxID=1962973 RepID=UPI003265E5F6
MTLEKLLNRLGYEGSPYFLKRDDGNFESEPSYGHIFRKALDLKRPKTPRWRVEGVYGVRDLETKAHRFLPVVYVCTADDAAAAQELHRLVWNQDVVPYVLVLTPKGVTAYSGYRFSADAKTNDKKGVLAALTDFNHAQEIVDLFHAREVDSGQIWKHPRLKVDTSQRVYHELLKTLRNLDTALQADELSKEVSHALIGKYVYLRYLRDRGILSDERLSIWGLKESDIFGNKAKKGSLEKLTEALDGWLNGEVFPLPWRGPASPSPAHFQAVAGAFHGDESHSNGTQLQLDLQPYDFSYIPIETLSLVYEQFLHIEKKKPAKDDDQAETKPTKGRTEGAYYTPLPLVNFMLADMEQRRPLKKGMKIFDPSCGSGAFLVQAYRLLIEKTFPNQRPKPKDLRDLLESSIFGCDVDGDACQVTQLSLLLTLLDYVDPPDLTGPMHSFKLPTLGESKDPKKIAEGHTPNILKGNFFGIEPALRAAVARKKSAKFDWLIHGFDWVVGNPPWKTIRPKKLGENDSPVWDWMKDHEKTQPVGLNQAAQAFVWAAPRYLKAEGECTLLVPAMGLFEEPSAEFRKAFFDQYQVHNVANFTNLAEVLFDGRARVPAAAISYRVRLSGETSEPDEAITVFSPFVVNQEPTCPASEGERTKIWSLVINGSEIQTLGQRQAATGSSLPWKLAMWGSPWDDQLLKRLERKWPSLLRLEAKWNSKRQDFIKTDELQVVNVSEGLQLREKDGADVEPADYLQERLTMEMSAMDRWRHVFSLPKDSLKNLENHSYFALKGRLKRPLSVSTSPQIIVSAARSFAIYSEKSIIVPSRQIGIISCTKDKNFLKALSLFLSSDFAFYHQFFRSTQLGIKREVSTLEALRKMPIPLTGLPPSELAKWVELHSKLAKCPPRRVDERKQTVKHPDLFESGESDFDTLLKQLNRMTYDLLGLDEQERALIHDLVQVRYALNDGKRGDAAMREPEPAELLAYAKALKLELDDFVGQEAGREHRVTVVTDGESAMVEIDFTQDLKAAKKPQVLAASSDEAAALHKTKSKVLREKAQWVYFNRNLRIYRDRKTYVFKPLNRFHWTQSSALTDASEIIAETLEGVPN